MLGSIYQFNYVSDFHVVPLLNYLAIANVPIAEIDALL